MDRLVGQRVIYLVFNLCLPGWLKTRTLDDSKLFVSDSRLASDEVVI